MLGWGGLRRGGLPFELLGPSFQLVLALLERLGAVGQPAAELPCLGVRLRLLLQLALQGLFACQRLLELGPELLRLARFDFLVDGRVGFDLGLGCGVLGRAFGLDGLLRGIRAALLELRAETGPEALLGLDPGAVGSLGDAASTASVRNATSSDPPFGVPRSVYEGRTKALPRLEPALAVPWGGRGHPRRMETNAAKEER